MLDYHSLGRLLISIFFASLAFLLAGNSLAQENAAKRQVAQIMTIGIDGSDPQLVLQSQGFQAPNWSPDGKWLICNGKNALWRIAADGSTKPEKIPTGDVKGINNDHVLSPDGQTIFFSAGQHLYSVPFAGGQPKRISNEHSTERQFKYYLHGISPDAETLAYVGAELDGDDPWGRLDLYTIPAAGGADTRLTNTPAPDDGPEYSPDGQWIYFNSESTRKCPVTHSVIA